MRSRPRLAAFDVLAVDEPCDAAANVVADRAHGVDALAFRIVEGPVVALHAGEDGALVAALKHFSNIPLSYSSPHCY